MLYFILKPTKLLLPRRPLSCRHWVRVLPEEDELVVPGQAEQTRGTLTVPAVPWTRVHPHLPLSQPLLVPARPSL